MRRQFWTVAAVVCLFAFLFASQPGSAAEAKAKSGTDAAAQKARCDAKCRHDYQGNASAIDACIRNCGATGPASGAKFHGNTLNQTSFREEAPKSSTGAAPEPVSVQQQQHQREQQMLGQRAAGSSTSGAQPAESTTVKSSKSNSSERAVHAGVKDPTPAEATNLNSSKSNADREGVPSGSGVQPAQTPTVKSSKSNSSDRASTTLNASKSNNYRQSDLSTSGTVTKVDAAGKTISLRRKDGSIIVMDASKFTAGLPKIGQSVNVEYTDAAGKPTVVSMTVSDPGVPNK